MQSLTDKQIKKLIELVRPNTILYDKHHPNYKSKITKLRIWADISAKLDISIDIAQKAWRSLRDQYGRYRLDVSTKTSMGSEARKVYKYYHDLQFLTGEMDPISIQDNIKQEEYTIQDALFISPSLTPPTECSPVITELSSAAPSPSSAPNLTPPPIKKKCITNFYDDSKHDDMYSKFFDSAAATIRMYDLTPSEFFDFQLHVLASMKEKLKDMGKF
ncbi:transcription factor Adf-1-like [Teleopsis dalmanni]|uniref:transcription factor Adf-1-like n=1 Tax=Teleopsis dalmanni TaxID=139649 RepID=UPI0018CF8ABB|nr:transcription factor Adf-1-like [Teleopsis dalmanni]